MIGAPAREATEHESLLVIVRGACPKAAGVSMSRSPMSNATEIALKCSCRRVVVVEVTDSVVEDAANIGPLMFDVLSRAGRCYCVPVEVAS